MSSSSGTTSTSSTSTIVTTAVFNIVVFAVFITAFLLLRPRHKNVYQPRVVAKTAINDRPRPLASGMIAWFKDLITRSDAEILQDAGLDGYFFLRYLRLIFFICLVGILVLYPVLLAVNATGGGARQSNGSVKAQTGFDILAFVNVANKNRYYAHVLIGWVFFGFILFTLYRELHYYVAVRQAVLTSPAYSNLVSSRTVLIQTLPEEYLNPESLAGLFDGVKFVFVNRKLKDLVKKVKARTKMAGKIEGAENSLLKTAVKNRLKSEKKGKNLIEGDNIELYVPNKKRPTHRLKPLVGKKVDTINYCSEQIESVNADIERLQAEASEAPTMNSAFITFHTQEQAETAFQVLSHHLSLHMAPRYIGIKPEDVVWSNLRLQWWERLFRSFGAAAFIIALIIFWSIPVAFVGFISNITALETKFPWLKFLNKLPKPLMGLVTGLLPTIMLAVLMMLLPIVLRLMAKVAGAPSKPLVEYYTQSSYFGFQVVQVFLVTTLTSGAASAVDEIISNPSSAMTLLAQNLPKASNFYIAYFLLQGFTACGTMLLQLVALILFYVLGFILDGTARKKWNRSNVIGQLGWGTVFPVYTNLAVISITYAIIAPLLLAFSAITFGLIYVAYLHNLIFVKQPSDGRGIYYARAIFQTFTGLYLAQICLVGLFVLAKTWGPVALQVIFLVVTIFVHRNLSAAFDPLLFRLPRSLMAPTENRSDIDPHAALEQKEGPFVDVPMETMDNSKAPLSNSSKGPSTSSSKGTPTLSQAEAGHRSVIPTGGAIKRFFQPYLFLTPDVLYRELLTAPIFNEHTQPLSDEEESVAYNHPAVTDTNPVVWIPRDPWGLAATEVQSLRERTVNATDEGAWFDIDATKKKSKFAFSPAVQDIPVWSPPAKQ